MKFKREGITLLPHMTISIPTGTFDIIPDDVKEPWRSSHLWTYIESVMREHARLYGFEEIRTPLFERTELFCRSVGDASDIVSKEMYTFEDKGGRSLSLRPEGTASVIRAFVEKQMQTQKALQRLSYIGPMFRYERPQSGRYRQHHQFGVEVIGFSRPELDAELIEMLYSLYEKLGLKHLTVHLNSIGDKESRVKFREALINYLKPHFEALSDDSKRRFELNPLRIFDSKAECDKEIMKSAPTILEHLTPDCEAHFAQVRRTLDRLQIPYVVNSSLVRGLDYYTKTVFEITSGELGAQNTIGAGGRYDGLVKDLGGADLPSIGFATGIERVLQTIAKQNAPTPPKRVPQVYVIALGEEALMRGVLLVRELRQKGVMALLDTSGKKLKQGMQLASESGALYSIVLGDNELATGISDIKEMSSGTVQKIALDELALFFNTHMGR